MFHKKTRLINLHWSKLERLKRTLLYPELEFKCMVLSPTELANTVTAYVTTISGLIPLIMSFVKRKSNRPPLRWILVYLCIVITGVATIWYHGFGESFWQGTADISTNLLLAWMLQFAVTFDHEPNKKKKIGIIVSGIIVGGYVAFRIIGFFIIGESIRYTLRLDFGEYGYFSIGELLLIANSLMGTVYLYLNHRHYPKDTRGYLYFSTALFLIGAGVASAGNHEILLEVIPMHALWHCIAGFGFILIWVFNEVRFKQDTEITKIQKQ